MIRVTVDLLQRAALAVFTAGALGGCFLDGSSGGAGATGNESTVTGDAGSTAPAASTSTPTAFGTPVPVSAPATSADAPAVSASKATDDPSAPAAVVADPAPVEAPKPAPVVAAPVVAAPVTVAPAPAPAPAPTTPKETVYGGITMYGQSNIVIENKRVENGSGPCIRLHNVSNVTIRNVDLVGCYGVGVELYQSSNITVTFSYFENLNGGVYSIGGSNIKVNNNRFKNVSRAGKMDYSRGQFVQFNGVTGAGNEIMNNRGINILGQSDPEDLVNLYGSSGTPASPIVVAGNCFKGGGPSPSGGGILAGENGGSYLVVRDNTLVNPGQYGIGIAGGRGIEMTGNRVYGRQQHFTNVGMYLMNFNRSGFACDGHKITNNAIDYIRSTGLPNPWYTDGACSAGLQMSGNNLNASLSSLDCSI